MASITDEPVRRGKAKGIQGMSLTMVLFISMLLMGLVFLSIQYIRIHSRYVTSLETVADLESQLAKLKEDNDAYYSSILSEVDLEELKKIAISRFGMKIPDEDHKDTYTLEADNGYLYQYVEISDE